MANATARVPSASVPWGDDKKELGLKATAAVYYPGAMIAIDSSGRGVKCDDTSGIVFQGLNAESDRVQVFSTDADGDRVLKVKRPWRFVMAIASAAAGDEGKKLYAVDDNHVGYTSSNSILVGFVDQVLSATSVLVNPLYAPLNPVAVSSNTLAFSGATTANQITMPDNLADALSVAEGSNEYLTFTTTDGSELITAKKALLVNASSAVALEVGPNGATNPTLKVVTNVSSEAGGLSVTGAADNLGVALAAIGSNTNEPLKLDGKGSGLISIGTVSTGGAVLRTRVATVATGGTAIGNANAVDEGFYYVTGADNTSAIILPASVAGKVVTVKNTVATAIIPIFPPASSQINAKGVNNAYNIPNAGVRTFRCVSTTLWYTDPETIA